MLSVHATDKVLARSICICKVGYSATSYHYDHAPITLTGILCGECRDGKGVSALLSNCVSCSNVQGLLLLALSMNILEQLLACLSSITYYSC